MPILHQDYETKSVISLAGAGAWRYSKHPETDVLVCAFAIDDGPVRLWLPGDSIPAEFIEAANSPEWLACAFNDGFERLIGLHILAPRYGWPVIPIERRRCTQAAASALALPASLEKVAAALSLEQRKDSAGQRNMLDMSRPRKPRKGENPDGIYWHDDDPERLEKLCAYCTQDVETERALYGRIGFLSDEEQAVWLLDQKINDRGVQIDCKLAGAAIHVAETARAKIDAEAAELTGAKITSVNQAQRLVAWLAAHECEVKDAQKETLRHALTRKSIPPEARRIIELRLDGAHAAANKFKTMLAWQNDGRVHGAFKYHGASTGRWTSYGIQLQNLKRPLTEDIGAAIEAVSAGDYDHLRCLYPQPLAVVGDVARATICASPNHRLIAADLSGIESRVTAWLSGQQSKLGQWAKFDNTKDPEDEPYFILGHNVCGLPRELARDKGKIMDLAFGYQGGENAWHNAAGPDDASSAAEIKQYQEAWKSAHPATVRFWGDINRAAIKAAQSPGRAVKCNERITFKLEGDFLRMRLPNGRKLAYPFPRLITTPRGECAVLFKDSQKGKWVDCRHGQGAYGGLWTENAVSAVARDIFAAAMQRLEAAGYPIVLHVHDEIVAEVPLGSGSQEEFLRILSALPDWAKGLPVAAKVREGERFCKTVQDQKPHGTFDHVREKARENRANGQGKNNEWLTPPEILEMARDVLGAFDLDPASCEEANKNVKAARFYSAKDDGLAQEWRGRVWLNPPYSMPEIEQFIEKLVAEVRAGRVIEAIALTDNKTDTAWFKTANQSAAAICFTKRIRFLRPDGGPGFLPNRGQALFYFGQNKQRFAEVFEPLGFVSAPAQDTPTRDRSFSSAGPCEALGSGGNGHDGYQSGEREWGRSETEYIYRTESGEPYLRIVRTSAKQFPQFHWAEGRWVPGKPKGPKIPYRLPELLAAAPETEVWFCEGEKDADNVAALGLVATTYSEGAKVRWPAEISKWFAGKRTVYVLEDNDGDGRRHASKVADALKNLVHEVRIVSFPELPERGDVSDWLDQGFTRAQLLARAKIGRPPARDECIIICAADIQPRNMPWLWYGHLPADALEIIAGVPDAGKSQVQCQYVACVTTKRPWPDGAPGMCEPRSVIMLTAEDTLEGMLIPRLIAAGADLNRVKILKGVRKDDREQMFLLAEDLEMLERTIAGIGDVGLVAVDPITAYMGGKVDSHRATDVRSQLGPLKDLAERARVGFSVLTHPPKNAGQRAIDQYLGSQAFIAAPRIGHLCLEEFEQDEYGQRHPTGRRLFTNSKNNPMPKRPTIAYRIVDAIGGTDPITGAGVKISKIAWEEAIGITADEALAASSIKKNRPDARMVLMDILASGPVHVKLIEERAAAHGLSKAQLKYAKEKMGVGVFKERTEDGRWFWALPQHMPEEEDAA